jgi:hypothetical protein
MSLFMGDQLFTYADRCGQVRPHVDMRDIVHGLDEL